MRHSSGNQKTLRVALLPTLLAGLLAACGGGGTTGQAVTGKVMDGYLSGATVCYDANSNGSCDSDEPQATSTAGGVYSFSVGSDVDLSSGRIVVDVPATAIDEDTNAAVGQAYKLMGLLSSPGVVSPLTTAVMSEMLATPTLTIAEAKAQAAAKLGLNADDLMSDYISAGNTGVHNAAKVLAVALQRTDLSPSTLASALQSYQAVIARVKDSTALDQDAIRLEVSAYGPVSSSVTSLAFASGYTGLTPAELEAIGYAYQGRTTEGGAFNWTVADGGSYGWGGSDFWWSGVASADSVPNFYWGGAGKADQAYMESWVNAPDDGTLALSGQGKLRLAVWGNDELVGQPRFTPVIQLADNGSGCYARAEAPPLTPAATGAATYDVSLTTFSVVENCGVEMTTAEFMAKPIGSVRVRIYKENYYTENGAFGKPNGINLGPISFQP